MTPRRCWLNVLFVWFLALGSSVTTVAAGEVPPAPPASRYQTPTLSEGRHIPLPPVVIPVTPAHPDRRPVWVGAGIVVIAALLWWNRKRRAELDHR